MQSSISQLQHSKQNQLCISSADQNCLKRTALIVCKTRDLHFAFNCNIYIFLNYIAHDESRTRVERKLKLTIYHNYHLICITINEVKRELKDENVDLSIMYVINY